jgi:trafficking protein particle complex subunit 9
MTVVQKESVEVIVTIKNPFVFDLEIQSITLRYIDRFLSAASSFLIVSSTSGVEFEHKPATILVPPNSFYPVVITGRAMEPGVLTIKGCIVQAPDGAPREFILPLSTGEEDERESRRRSAFRSESERFKYGGLESLPWEKSRKRSSTVGVPERTSARTPRRFLECKVVPEQPLLRVRRTSLTHGALMLYDGETYVSL